MSLSLSIRVLTHTHTQLVIVTVQLKALGWQIKTELEAVVMKRVTHRESAAGQRKSKT